MKNHLDRTHRTRRAAGLVLTSMITTVTAAVTMAYLVVGPLAVGADRRLRQRITDRRDRGALSLEQAILTAVLSAAAIALGAFILNAILGHQNQIR